MTSEDIKHQLIIFGASVGLSGDRGGGVGGVLPGSTGTLPSESSRLPGSWGGGGGGGVLVMFLHSLAEGGLLENMALPIG